MKKKWRDFIWGVRLAWKIDKKMLLFWGGLSVLISLFPALILFEYRRVLSVLSEFLYSGVGMYADILAKIILLGLLITISGLSARLNQDFLYMTMYDSFYLGLEDTLMEAAQRIDLMELVKKDTSDEFYGANLRCGALTDLTSAGCALIGSIVSIVSILVVSCTVSPIVCLIAVVYVLFVLCVNIKSSDKVRVVWNDMQARLRKAEYIRKLVQEGDTAKETRIFRNIGLLKKDWYSARKNADKLKLDQAKAQAKVNLLIQLGFYSFLTAVIGFGLFLLGQGRMESYVLLVLFSLGIDISEEVAKVPNCYRRFDYGLYGLGLQREFYGKTPATTPEKEALKQDTPADEEKCFEADDLSFAYPGGQKVLDKMSFTIHKGETVALVGVNGSGKTTLLKVLMGLYRPTSGTLKFQGREYDEYKQGYLSRKIGAFFQDFVLFHFTVQENVGLGNIDHMEDEAMVWDALKKGGAAKMVSSWKAGLKQRLVKEIYKDAYQLSGGESQRVAVARTHMSDKEILIFDEPASMLDPIAEMEQFYYIREKLEGHTAILVSHRVGFARLADRILVLDQGHIRESGTHEELLKANGLYAKLFHEQAGWYDLTASEGERA